MKTNRIIQSAVVCAILLGGSRQTACAATPDFDGAFAGPAIIKALAGLQITEAQKTGIARVAASHRDENRAAIEDYVGTRKQLFALIHADSPDETAIRLASRIVAQKEEELNVLRARTLHDLKTVLTDEQRAKVVAFRERAMKRLEAQKGRIPGLVDAWVDARMAP